MMEPDFGKMKIGTIADTLPASQESVCYTDSWNPMSEESNNILSTMSNTKFDFVSVITGQPELDRKPSEIACKFFNGKDDKCKRANCKYSHDMKLYDARISGNHELIVQKNTVKIFMTSQLWPKQSAPNGTINIGSVVSITNPGDFFIIPFDSWRCACEEKNLSDPTGSKDLTGIENLTLMWKSLKHYTANSSRDRHHYVQSELVGVEIATGNKTKQWFRAVVLKDVVLGETNQFPVAYLRLVDIGSSIVTTTKDMIPLPEVLLRYPPLSYRCSLFGVSPLRHKWSTKAIELFKSLVYGKECIYEIRQARPTDVIEDQSFEPNPYIVDIHAKVNTKYKNVAELLEQHAHALAWHPYPARPFALNDIPDQKGFAHLFTPMDCCHSKLTPENSKEVLDRELERINRYLNRIPFTENDKQLIFPKGNPSSTNIKVGLKFKR